MIELPNECCAASADHELVDFGFFQRGALGAETARINRAGNRYRVSFVYGPYYQDLGSKVVARLQSAKTEGLRVPYPLPISQGSPGTPLVDGAGQSGTTLNIKGLAAGYTCREGYWLSIETAAGRHYLHSVKTGGQADATGDLSVVLNTALLTEFADGDTVHLAKPMIEGWLVEGGDNWPSNADKTVTVSFTLEEKG